VVKFQVNQSSRTYYLNWSKLLLLFWQIRRQSVLSWLFSAQSIQICNGLILNSKCRLNDTYLDPKLMHGLGLQGFLIWPGFIE
jgi:hypothetical protein